MDGGASTRVSPAAAWARALGSVAALQADPAATLPARLDALAVAHGARPALIGPGETLSYGALASRCRQHARWAHAAGIAKGDVVALMLPPDADYPALWLGIARVGGIAALVNPALRGTALRHAIAASGARLVLTAPAWLHDLRAELPGIALAVPAPADHAAGPLPAMGVCLDDPALLIFTSGTTGLPKAARITHARILEWAGWFAGMMDAAPDDRLYNCLPLHHSTGGVLGIGAMLVSGGAVVIRERFSARRFWPDVAETQSTIFLYIGELCRYLLTAPEAPPHTLRLACGNGLRAPVWHRFAARFGIPRILEFYASTEGNVSLTNVEGQPGAIGRLPPFLAHRDAVALLACDPQTGEWRRDADGRRRRATVDEPGEAIGRIGNGARRFDGYTDPAATSEKILRDVFTPGDAWFRTGDLMRRDAAGFFYFIDRLGDTFRWKGENVSTTEVAEVIGACPGITGVAVYGVEVPGEEGRAGMAAIAVNDDFTFPALHALLARELPSHARPRYLRLCREIESTATFKPLKTQLANEGFGPNPANDPVFLRDDIGFQHI